MLGVLVVTPDVVAVTVVAASADVASSTIVTLALEINSIWLRSESIFSLSRSTFIYMLLV